VRGGAAAAAQAASEAPLPSAFRPFVAQAPAACAGAPRAPPPAPPPASVRAWLGGLQLERHAAAFEAVRGLGRRLEVAAAQGFCSGVCTRPRSAAMGVLCNPPERGYCEAHAMGLARSPSSLEPTLAQ